MNQRRQSTLSVQGDKNSELNNFRINDNRPWNLIKSKFGRRLTLNELFHLLILFQRVTGVESTRAVRRNKTLLLKFFDDNFNSFQTFISRVAYVDEGGNYGGPMAEEAQSFNSNDVSEPEDVN